MTSIQGWVLALGGCLWLLAGCAGVDHRAVTEQLNQAQDAVAAAENNNAKIFSPENLKHAQDALVIAQDAMHSQAWEQAWTFARKSWLYARLAHGQAGQKLAEERLQTLQKTITATATPPASALPAEPSGDVGAPETQP